MSDRQHRRFTMKSEINIVPLLDVLLVLLLIFMATAPVISQSVEVDLPQSTESKNVSDNENPPIIVEVSGVETYTLIVNQNRMEQLPKEQIISEVKQLITDNEKAVFLIGGAKDVAYEEIIKALNLLQTSGVKSVGLMTQSI